MLNTNMIKLGLWEVIVPRGVRYISEWSGYDFAEFPCRCIIDKQIPGCGYTEWCISNMYNVILASPRKILLENKAEQHPGEVFLVQNEFDQDPSVDKDLNKVTDKKKNTTTIEKELAIEKVGFVSDDLYSKLRNDLIDYLNQKQGPKKILVTYDSYYIVKSILRNLGIFETFYTVVDEMQSILHDSRFKSTTELEFMTALKDVQYIQFISATPMLEKYLKMLPDFKDIDIFQFNWEKEDPTRVTRPNLKVLVMKSINEMIVPIIDKYKSGNFDKIMVQNKDGSLREVISDEVVFYVNSVNHILNVIKKCNLQSEQVNILCSRTPENTKKVRTKLGKEWTIGRVPVNEKPKMFTFCTRTVYLGADFYSKCAQSYIFSDSNSDCLAVDISQDLPQILGRQRLEENPWKNSATLYYRSTADYRKMKKEDFDAFIQKKLDRTNDLLRGYQNNISLGDHTAARSIAEEMRRNAKAFSYESNYVAVNVKSDHLEPVINEYVRVSDIRAFDIQQIDYADRFSVFREIEEKIYGNTVGIISGLIKQYDSLNNNITERLKFICEVDPNLVSIFLQQLNNDDYAKSYYLQLGPDRCRALGYKIDRIRKELGIIKFDKQFLEKEIHLIFSSGQKISKAALKLMLADIYKRVNYDRVAKASDLSEWFELKLIKVKESDGTYSNGFELLKKK